MPLDFRVRRRNRCSNGFSAKLFLLVYHQCVFCTRLLEQDQWVVFRYEQLQYGICITGTETFEIVCLTLLLALNWPKVTRISTALLRPKRHAKQSDSSSFIRSERQTSDVHERTYRRITEWLQFEFVMLTLNCLVAWSHDFWQLVPAYTVVPVVNINNRLLALHFGLLEAHQWLVKIWKLSTTLSEVFKTHLSTRTEVTRCSCERQSELP